MKTERPEFVGSGSNRIVLDWDGTLVESVWPAQGDWLPEARWFVQSLLDTGMEVVVMSTRIAPVQIDEVTVTDPIEEISYIRRMLDEAGFEKVSIWDFRDRPWKPGGHFYVDDKGLRFSPREGLGYDVLLEKILEGVLA